MDSKYRVLKSMDNPMRVFVWDVDQIFVVLGPILLGILMSSMLIMILGAVLGYLYTQLRRGSNRGDFVSMAYWYLPTSFLRKRGFFTNLPDSHEREIIS